MSRVGRFFYRSMWTLLSLFITFIIVVCAVYTYIEIQLPDVSVLKDVHMQVPLKIYTRNGKLVAQYGVKRRTPVKLEDVPPLMIQAVLATEDARYYSHPGVDLISLIRAARAVIRSGRKSQGASTITMQVARNFFLTRKKTYSRKIKEILLAIKIDKEFSKKKILELYLNKVYFGKRAYGIAAASQVYYGKKLNQLTLPQIAMIAGLPQAPSRNNPLNNPKGAVERRNHVLKRMLETGYIDKVTYKKAIKAPITAKHHGQRVLVRAPYVAEMVRRLIVEEYGRKHAYDSGIKVYTTLSANLQNAARKALKQGLIAYSKRHGFRVPGMNLGIPTAADRASWVDTLKRLGRVGRMQPAAVLALGDRTVYALLANENIITIPWSSLSWARPALRDGYKGHAPRQASDIVKPGDVIWLRKGGDDVWHLSQLPEVEGALVALNPQNGGILALVGGFDYRISKFNRAIQAERQPGSNFKPFVYSAALAKGYTLASIINDAPIVIYDTGENRLWRPMNSTLRFYGPTRLRVGLTKSRNIVSIRLLRAIGIPYTIKYLRRFGLNPNKLPKSLSLALGSGSVTPLQIATGYAVFANGGYRVLPHFVERIVGQNNEVLFKADPPIACEACINHSNVPESALPKSLAPQVITPQNAYIITQAMRGVIQSGTGRGAKVLHRRDLAGKTGTTNDQVDAWFSGFNSHIVTTVWVGYDNLRPLHEYGAQAALPIWISFMRQALAGTAEATMPMPPGIITARINPRNGLLASPNQRSAIFEVFRKNHVPTRFSPALNVASPSTRSYRYQTGDASVNDTGHLF